jgi:hypothetical protein
MRWEFSRRYATGTGFWFFPALKGRAKFMPTLRVEEMIILKASRRSEPVD